MVEKNQAQVKEIPAVAKVISVLYYVLSVVAIGCLMIIMGGFLGSNWIMLVALIVIALLFIFLFFFIGKGLWKGDNWSRIAAIVIAILNIIVTILMLIIISYLSKQMVSANTNQNVQNILKIFDISKFIPKAIISIIINGLIAGYLLFSNKVKEAFI